MSGEPCGILGLSTHFASLSTGSQRGKVGHILPPAEGAQTELDDGASVGRAHDHCPDPAPLRGTAPAPTWVSTAGPGVFCSRGNTAVGIQH